MRTTFFYAVLFMTVITGKSWAMYSDVDTSDFVPIKQLIDNLSIYVKENPEDAHGYYLLGRAHSLAFAKHSLVEMYVYEDDSKTRKRKLPLFKSHYHIKINDNVISEEQIEHLLNSIKNYYYATKYNPNKALYFLGLGWMLEQGRLYAKVLGPPPYEIEHIDESLNQERLNRISENMSNLEQVYDVSHFYYNREVLNSYFKAWINANENKKQYLVPLVKKLWDEECLWAYRQAFQLYIHKEVQQKSSGGGIESHIGSEAGTGFIRVLGTKAAELEYKWEVEAIIQAINIAKSGPEIVTPIIFSMQDTDSVDELLAPTKHVRFNMDGLSDDSVWSWVKDDTAILVWDPEQHGEIKSGKQLFGSVTWWLFWENGYQAMAMLDDDHNGFLEEHELSGLAVWQDRNQNGLSDDGEVIPIESTDIERMAVQPEVNLGKTIHHKKGIQLKSGAWLPSYDWFPDRIVYPAE